MNKTEAIKKINTMGKAGSIICLIAKILLFIGAAFVLALTIASVVLPKDLITLSNQSNLGCTVNLETFTKNMSDSERGEIESSFSNWKDGNSSITVNNSNYSVDDFSYNDNKLSVTTAMSAKSFDLGNLRIIMIIALVSIACSLLSVYFAGSLCKSFAACTSPFDAIIITKMRRLAYSLIPMAILSCFSDSLISSVLAGGTTVSLTVNFSVIFAILIILAISYIFKYGAQLQEESDETL